MERGPARTQFGFLPMCVVASNTCRPALTAGVLSRYCTRAFACRSMSSLRRAAIPIVIGEQKDKALVRRNRQVDLRVGGSKTN